MGDRAQREKQKLRRQRARQAVTDRNWDVVRDEVVNERLWEKSIRELKAQTERLNYKPEEESWHKCKSVLQYDEVFKAHRKIQRTQPLGRKRVFSKSTSNARTQNHTACGNVTDSMHKLKLPQLYS